MNVFKYAKEAVKLAAIPASMKMGRPLTVPSVAAFYLTKRCNSRCSMCRFWQQDFDPGQELTAAHIGTVLEDLARMGVSFVSFGAEGEVFTRTDAIHIFEHARALGFDYTINTNGLYLPEAFVERVRVLSPHGIVFGLDTADPDQYARIRGIPGGFDKVISSIRRLKRAGFDNISIGAVVLKDNLDDLLPLAELALREKIRAVRFTAFSPVGFGMQWDPMELRAYQDTTYLKQLDEVIGKLLNHKRRHDVISNSGAYLRRIREHYQRGFTYLPASCVIGYYNIQVMPNGDVPVCGFRGPEAVVGNVRQTSIIHIWHSGAYQANRDQIAQGGCPTCWMSCYAENNLRFHPKTAVQANLGALKRGLHRGLTRP